ncbi:histone deacetylation protein Rxt3-domain-containing protein [Chaetomidium leptoderma]|uniref:Histone deacetylation protein Rxt3-domain-containing protein n=1 Tax=Chaetomidium leptoderma TaxID=669021 RepID=A0AAN6ZY89_9PEZI|nr:histone deacetylation protein Rxt3-domain-containing protein [Chaetomidium leptoderma]
MDPRQPPQHPFSRNAASPFPRPSFPPTPGMPTSLPPYPPTVGSHPPATAGPYSEMPMPARKPSDPGPYFAPPRQYPPEHGPGPMPTSTHSRHQSTSSVASGPAMTRGMPPLNSPPQQQPQQGQGPNGHQIGKPYGLPQPRPPPHSAGPPEQPAPHQYGPPPSPAAPGQPYNQPLHASPRPHATTASEYFRRPQTPEHHRMYEHRDPRAASAASPSAYHSTPELQRYGTPQAYPPRGPPPPAADQPREAGRMPPGTSSSRPMSPPRQYANVGPPRPVEAGRPPEMYAQREELRPSEEYNPERPIRYEVSRYMSDRGRQELERQQREMAEVVRLSQRREMEAMAEVEASRAHGMHQQEYARQMEQRPQQYGGPPDPRDWTRPGFEPARAPYDPAMHPPRHQEYPPSTTPHYNGPHPYPSGTVERHHQPPHHPHLQHNLPPAVAQAQPYESPDRQRMGPMHMDRSHPQQPTPRSREEAAVPPPSVAYGGMGPSMYEASRNRSMEEISTPHGPQRSLLLGIQEINRKGRISPLPQAVQGAQPQLAGPAGEPGIKSEFGRMFSGIGTGVGTISSPVPAGAQLAYSNTGLLRRDDLDPPQEPPVEVIKTTGRGKRRKPREEDDEANSGRLTPVGGRAKKQKGHHHHHHHHHHRHNLDQVPAPALAGNTPFRNVKGSTPAPSPTSGLAKDLPGGHHHHHHHHAAPRQPNARAVPPPRSPSPVILPKPRQVVSSKAVVDSVADRPRTHLGDVVYEPTLKRARLQDPCTGRPPRSGYKSTPKPLPWNLIEGKENSTLTMKIGKEHLVSAAREEITARRALWGTDVYTDDSDVIAACVHGGWFRGEWPDDIDVSMLGLDECYVVSDLRGLLHNGIADSTKNTRLPSLHSTSAMTVLLEPPKTGPMLVPENRDLHVTLLILPRLEKYWSSTRFGVRSREFGGPVGDKEHHQHAVHDGISFMITGLRWVTNGAAPQDRLRGKVRRERIRKWLADVELTPAWISRPVHSGRGGGNGRNGAAKNNRGGAGLGWWGLSELSESRTPSEGDKENQNRAGEGLQKQQQRQQLLQKRHEQELPQVVVQEDKDKDDQEMIGNEQIEVEMAVEAEPEPAKEKGDAAADAEEVPKAASPVEDGPTEKASEPKDAPDQNGEAPTGEEHSTAHSEKVAEEKGAEEKVAEA